MFCLEPLGVIIFGHEDGKEHGIDTARFGTDEIELSIGDTVAHIAPVIELAVRYVNMSIEYECVFVQPFRALRHGGQQRQDGQQ